MLPKESILETNFVNNGEMCICLFKSVKRNRSEFD